LPSKDKKFASTDFAQRKSIEGQHPFSCALYGTKNAGKRDGRSADEQVRIGNAWTEALEELGTDFQKI
jgi:hypothetical protein